MLNDPFPQSVTGYLSNAFNWYTMEYPTIVYTTKIPVTGGVIH